jgi:Autographiviridae endonuclease VII
MDRQCKRCHQSKAETDFYPKYDRRRQRKPCRTECKDCSNKRQRVYHKAYIRKVANGDPKWYRDKNLRSLYGISLEQFTAILESQGGTCAICSGPPMGSGTYHVDHDHATGQIRGLLCHKCNVSLGMVQDSVEHLQKLIDYLSKHVLAAGEPAA